MELDLFDELMELYSKNKGVKEVKNWEELELGTRKWYKTDFKKFHIVGDGIKAKYEIPFESLHSSDDFCFGINEDILFYRTYLLFRGYKSDTLKKFYRVNYANFGSIDFYTDRYWGRNGDFKGYPIVLDDSREVFKDVNHLIQERFNRLEKPKKSAAIEKENRRNELNELDLYDEIMELYLKNEGVKEIKKWGELVLNIKKRSDDWRLLEVNGDDIKSGIKLGRLHSSDDFCFGIENKVLFYRTYLLVKNTGVASPLGYSRINYSNFGRDFVGKGYKGGKKGYFFNAYPTFDDAPLKVFNEINLLIQKRYNLLEQKKSEIKRKEEEIKRKQAEAQENKRLQKLKESKDKILNKLDQDGNGVLDIIEGSDYMKLLKKHQRQIKEIDRNYIQRFIQVSNFLKSQSETLQEMFTRIQKVRNQKELESLVGLLKNHIHTYEQILFHSLNMIVSLVEEDDLTFYEIYETFDKLHIFDSAWEKQVSQKLSDINLSIIDLMSSVDSMNADILNGLSELSYITEESNRNLVNQLGEIDSSIKVNNFLSGIQTYQLYKINKNTRSLRS